jgi:hypothetical protein
VSSSDSLLNQLFVPVLPASTMQSSMAILAYSPSGGAGRTQAAVRVTGRRGRSVYMAHGGLPAYLSKKLLAKLPQQRPDTCCKAQAARAAEGGLARAIAPSYSRQAYKYCAIYTGMHTPKLLHYSRKLASTSPVQICLESE